MHTRQKRLLFYTIWLLVVLTGPYVVLKNINIERVLENDILLLSTLQRLSGLLAFVLITSQIFIGAFMQRLVQVIGARAYRLHIVQGIFSVIFIFMHPIIQSIIDYKIEGVFRLFLVPVFDRPNEIYYFFGRAGFMVLILTIFIGYFRTRIQFRRIWRIVHILNYIAFYLVFYHSLKLGSDVKIFPFNIVFYGGTFLTSSVVIYRVFNYLSSKGLLFSQTSKSNQVTN